MVYREHIWFLSLFLVTSFALTAIGCADTKPSRGTQITALGGGGGAGGGGGNGRRGRHAPGSRAGNQQWQPLANPQQLGFAEMTAQFDVAMMKDSPAVKIEDLKPGNYITEHVYLLWKKDGDGGFAALFDLNVEANKMNGTYYYTSGKNVTPESPPFLVLNGLTLKPAGANKSELDVMTIKQLGFLFKIEAKPNDQSFAQIIYPAGKVNQDDDFKKALGTAPNASNMYGSANTKDKLTGIFIRKDGERFRISLDYNTATGTFLFVYVLKPSSVPAAAAPVTAAAPAAEDAVVSGGETTQP